MENKVIHFFEEISRIPRGSKNEKNISDYLVNFAKERNLEVSQDSSLNVVIRKNATKGYENIDAVALQSHMDMVNEKNIISEHDFDKDGIELIYKDDFIYANGTTLGADNGIGMALTLAILDDKSLKHPLIEGVFTADEEMGMTGAIGFSEGKLKSNTLINLDSEEEGKLLVSCAGGMSENVVFDLEYVEEKNECYKISIRGLKGGHSGMEINKERANANVLMARTLKRLSKDFEIKLNSIEGGNKSNAIPRESDSCVYINEKIEKINEKINEIKDEFNSEYVSSEAQIEVFVSSEKGKYKVISESDTKRFIDMMYLFPNGINSMSTDIDGLVVSSNNLGVVKTSDDEITIDFSIRSSVKSLKSHIGLKIETISEKFGAKAKCLGDYPEWSYDKDSKIRKHAENVYKEITGNEAEVIAIHAGVECGLFKEKYPNLDMVSLGPDIFDVHTPDEHFSISSTNRTYEFLVKMIEKLK